MAENINKRPSKSILKSSTSVERQSAAKRAKEQRFDEMNILATLHPADKDYGHMKIDEPKTPYSECVDPEDDDDPAQAQGTSKDEVDAHLLAAKLNANLKEPPLVLADKEESSEEEEDSETEEEKRQRLEFEARRKKHYNEFQAIQLARQLMQSEQDEDEEGEDEENNEDRPDGDSRIV